MSNEKRVDDPANPSRVFDRHGRLTGWRWYDENDEPSRTLYASEHAALHDLLRHVQRLPWWKRWWMKLWRRT